MSGWRVPLPASGPQCGYGSPHLGPCQCFNAANHEPGGIFYKEGRLPDWPPEGGRISAAQQLAEVVEVMDRERTA